MIMKSSVLNIISTEIKIATSCVLFNFNDKIIKMF